MEGKWMMKLLIPVLAFCMILWLDGSPVSAVDENGLSYEIIDGEAIITDGTGAEGMVEIPAAIEGYPVTAIGEKAFSGNRSLTGVTIPQSVTVIGEKAFYNCRNLTDPVIPEGVTSIGNYAFYYCSGLIDITIPGSVVSIGEDAFKYCSGLTSVTISEGAVSLGDDAFSWCTALTDVTIPDSMTVIGNYVFDGCKKLNYHVYESGKYLGNQQSPYLVLMDTVDEEIQTISLPTGIKFINQRAFDYCDSLTSVTIPEGVVSIGDGAFACCFALTEVTIPDTVVSIGERAFIYCSDLTSAPIPENVISIGASAFNGCESLTDVVIPQSVTDIGEKAFYECKSVTDITISKNVTHIGASAFSGCESLTGIWVNENNPAYSSDAYGVLFGENNTYLISAPGQLTGTYSIPEGVTSIGDAAFAFCEKLTAVTLPDGLVSIGQNGFYFCDRLTGVTIPASVTQIGEHAFVGCSKLVYIRIEENNSFYASDASGVLFDKDMRTLIKAPEGIRGIYHIPQTVTSIGEGAFWDCDALIGVSIPEGVAAIENNTFYGCAMINVTIPGSVTEIAHSAFSACFDLTNVGYGGTQSQWESVTIGTSNADLLDATMHFDYTDDVIMFWLSYEIQDGEVTITACENNISGELEIPETIQGYPVTAIGACAFYWCNELTEVTIPQTVTTIGAYAFYWCSELTDLVLPEGITAIEDYTFWTCQGLTNVTIPERVVSIGDYAFYGCAFMTDITLPKELSSIGDYAFASCSDLTDVTISGGVAAIGKSAFEKCTDLVNVTISEGVTAIGDSAFKECKSLTQAVIPNSVTAMGWGAFRDCKNLTEVKIPENLTCIEGYVFYNCSKLTGITIPSSVTSIGASAFENCDLMQVTVPEHVTDLGEYAFCGCLNMTNAILPESVTAIGKGAFGGCYDLTDVFYVGTPEQWQALEIDMNNTGLSKATVHCHPSNTMLHGYGSWETITPSACNREGEEIRTCVCGMTQTRSIAMADHTYGAQLVDPTCEEQGYTLYTCSVCGNSYQADYVEAAGHSFGNWKVSKLATCTKDGVAARTCVVCQKREEIPIEAAGHNYQDGSCTECGEMDPDDVNPLVAPTISLKYPTVSFEDVILMNVYFSAENLQDVAQMGLVTYTEKVTEPDVETAHQVIPGYTWSEGDGFYYVTTAGIAPKDIGDTIYFAIYYQLTDGTYGYTKVTGYSPKTYAMGQLNTGSPEMKALVVAMLNYGAAAQSYFGYHTDGMMNEALTADQQAYAQAYSDSMIAAVTQASGEKLGQFINDKTYSGRYPTISFEGAFCINYYFLPTEAVEGDVTMYIWSLEDYEAAEVLTRDNATKAVKMTLTETGEYLGVVDGIAAKDLDKAAYVTFCYNDGTTDHCGGVIAYTIGMYCKSQASKTGTLAELAKACAVYGYYAKQLFG